MPFNPFNRKKDNNSQPQEENTVANSQLQAQNTVTGLIEISGCNNPSRRADIIFVHGLGGDAFNTWHPKEGLNPLKPQQVLDNDSWLYWLGNDLQDVGVWTFGYEVNFTSWKGQAIPRFDQARIFLQELKNERIGRDRPVFFITHSLGGLVTKHALLYAQEYSEYETLIKNSKGIVFLATPHNGSDLANMVGLFSHILRTTISVEELEANNPWLRELNATYRQRLGRKESPLKIATEVYYETQKTLGYNKVVNEGSADPGLFDVMPVAVPTDHIQIAKPKSRKDLVYKSVRNFIEEHLPPQKFLPAANSNPIPELNSQDKAAPETVEAQPDNTQNLKKIADTIEKIGVLNNNTTIENQNNNINL